jgi:hypothetical protein
MFGEQMSEEFKRYLAKVTRYDMRFLYYMYKFWPKFSWESEEEFQEAKLSMIKAVEYDKSNY